MLTLIEIFSIITIHWLSDFVLQTEQQGKGKSKNWSDLLSHTGTYSLTWYIPILFFFPNNWIGAKLVIMSFIFVGITFIAHTITDYFTSRITSKRYQNNHFYGFNGFWFWIGLDQILHYIQLFLTYYLLTK